MARAATGLTEVACWQFIGAGVGGVVALLFFLVLGAMNGMEPKPKPDEIVAPLRVPSECVLWSDANPACTALKAAIENPVSGLTADKKAQLLESPCDLNIDFALVSAMGFYWQARCREVFTGTGCGAKDGTERTACEQDLAVKEASCAFLGLSPAPMSLAPNDADDPDTCLEYLKSNTVTQGQADRCATSRSMAWETLVFMTGGDMVNTHRCGAVTFAAVVAQGADTPMCKTSTAYNYNDGDGQDASSSVCQNERTCDNDVLRELISATDQGLSTGNPGEMDATWSTDTATKVTTTTCQMGWEAKAGTADYFCSHVPYTDDAGYPINKTGGRLTQADVSSSIGTWVGGLECERRSCPSQCGSDLGPQITGISGATVARPPPEGLTDTCCSGVFEDTCQIRCNRGYLPNGVHECTVTTANSQDTPAWDGATCDPMACYTAVLANTALTGTATHVTGNVGDPVPWEAYPCAAGFFQAGTISCQDSLLFQGGGCVSLPAVAPIPAAAPDSAMASSNVGQAELAFDNDPMTYWYSTDRAVTSEASPVWLEVTLPSSVVPLGFSVQLGKSTDFNSYLIKPTRWKFQGFNGVDYDDFYIVENNFLHGSSTDQVVWNPPCNDKTIDPIEIPDWCGADGAPPCTIDTSREVCDRVTGNNCQLPTNNPCGPTEFPIQLGTVAKTVAPYGQYTKFRMHITGEEAQPTRSERYGTIYIQDIAVMTAATVYQKDSVDNVRYAFEPMDNSCCGDDGDCAPVLNVGGSYQTTTWADCLEAVADLARDALAVDPVSDPVGYLQFTPAPSGQTNEGTCYWLLPSGSSTDLTGPKIVTATMEKGAMCWSVKQG